MDSQDNLFHLEVKTKERSDYTKVQKKRAWTDIFSVSIFLNEQSYYEPNVKYENANFKVL